MRTEQKLIELIFRDSSKKPALEPLCQRALESYQPPSRSLICIFDNEERPECIDSPQLGKNFCGFFVPLRELRMELLCWPYDIRMTDLLG
jgi:hypothetical protein